MEKYNIILIEESCVDNCIEKVLDNEWFTFFKIDSPGIIQIYNFPEPSLIICKTDQNTDHDNIKKLLRILNPHDSVPVLFIISPHDTDSYLQNFYSGISHHITPPFSRDFLFAKIFNLLGKYVKIDDGRTEFGIEYNNIQKKISLPNMNIFGFLVSVIENLVYKNSLIGEASELISLKNKIDIKNEIGKNKIKLDLNRAIEKDEWILYYQPIISLTDKKLYSFEALLRWNHPERGIISPHEFIEEVEDSPLIIPISLLVIKKAMAQLKKWQDKFKYPLKISINLSPRQFTSENLYDKILESVDSAGLPHESIAFEITENVFAADREAANLMFLKLRAQKFSIYMDDFGTGYSSLSYLYHFPVNVIKIDKSFVQWMHIDETSEHIVKSVISLAHNLGLKVIAEGAETSDHINKLMEYGADFVQGFNFSKPLSESDADEYISGII